MVWRRRFLTFPNVCLNFKHWLIRIFQLPFCATPVKKRLYLLTISVKLFEVAGWLQVQFFKFFVCILTCPTILSNYGTTRKNTQPYYTTKISNKIYVFATQIHHKIKIANKRVSIANDETCSESISCNLKACSVISIKLVIYFISLPLIGEEPGMETIPEAYI